LLSDTKIGTFPQALYDEAKVGMDRHPHEERLEVRLRVRRVARPTVVTRALPLLALMALLAAPPAPMAQLPSASELAEASAVDPAATITVWNRPVVVIRATVGHQTPAIRAAGIERKIEELPYRDLDSPVRIEQARAGGVDGLMVFVGGRLLFGILPADLDPLSSETLAQVGADVKARLEDVLHARLEATRVPVLLWGIGLALFATLALVASVWVLVRLRLWLLARVRSLAQRHGLQTLGVDVRPYAFAVLEGLTRLGTLTLGLIAGYLWLAFVLSRFPYTEPWSEQLGGYLRGLLEQLGLGALRAVPGFFAVLVIFFVTQLVARAVGAFFSAAEEGRVSVPWLQPETAKATNRLAAFAIWLFGVTVAYPYIPGSNTDAFKGVSVFAGIMISLGSAGLVNQLMSGLVIVYARALKSGDFVEIGETVGLVSEVGLLSTKIVTPKQEEVTIPNAVLIGGKVTNYSKLAAPDGAMVSTTVTIGYDAPWRQVHELLLSAAARTAGIRKAPEPFVLQRSLSDFYVEYELRFRVAKPEERFWLLSALHAEIQDRFNEARVQIMSPHFEKQPREPVLAVGQKPPPAGG
jgi:small-conductance mechanosensitive channel